MEKQYVKMFEEFSEASVNSNKEKILSLLSLIKDSLEEESWYNADSEMDDDMYFLQDNIKKSCSESTYDLFMKILNAYEKVRSHDESSDFYDSNRAEYNYRVMNSTEKLEQYEMSMDEVVDLLETFDMVMERI